MPPEHAEEGSSGRGSSRRGSSWRGSSGGAGADGTWQLDRRSLVAECDPFHVPDASGAYPVHALLIANTHDSVALAMRLFAARPELIPQSHSSGAYRNENALHILAANRRESEFIQLVDLGVAALDDARLTTMLLQQVDGRCTGQVQKIQI